MGSLIVEQILYKVNYIWCWQMKSEPHIDEVQIGDQRQLKLEFATIFTI